MTIGPSDATILEAEQLQRLGFYVLPVRPPTVPEGTSRLRFSLTAGVSEEEVRELIQSLEFKV
jgi:8-amino-7-oxononanoate synthase